MDLSHVKQMVKCAVERECFGNDFNFVDLVPTVKEGYDNFNFNVFFAKVILRKGHDENVVRVVIKKQQDNPFVREMMNSDLQFYNEVLMYRDILPFLEKNSVVKEMFPKMYYSNSTLGEEYKSDILVEEDLEPFGYQLANGNIFLNYEHVALILVKLGRFHSLSYTAKQENLNAFFQLVDKLKESIWVQENKDDSNRFLTISMERGIFPLVESGEDLDTLENFVKRVQDPFEMSLNLIHPEEPLAVICHGDLSRNNILFKYDNVGKPVDVKFFDLATARYASPAIDLAYFLFMNTTAELRRAHWEDFFRIYHQALTKAVPSSRVPSLEVIRREVERKAVYGYIHCSFFIPMMMDNTPKFELDDFASMPSELFDEMTRTKGGEQATRTISEIVKDLIRLKSI